MPRRRKSAATVPTPRGSAVPPPQESSAGPQGLNTSTLHLMEPFLSILVQAGVTDFQGFGVSIRLGPRPVIERRVLVPAPPHTEPPAVHHPGGLEPQRAPTGPLTPQAREAVLSRLEDQGVDEDNPIFDAVRRST